MKKLFTKLMALVAVFVLSAGYVRAADVQLRFTAAFSSTASKAFSTTDVLYAIDAATMSTSTSNVVFASPNNFRVQLKTIVLELKSTSAAAIKVYGMSSGSSSNRTIYQVSVANELNGTYTLLDDVTVSGTKITSNIYGQAVATSETAVTGLNIPMGKFVKISFCTSSASTSTQNLNISGFDITPLPSGPTITAFTAAGVTATINQTAKTITAELPYGTNLSSITPSVTIGGTATSYSPTGAQDFSGGAVNYVATDGTPANDITYAVTLTASSVANSDATLNDLKVDGTTVAGFSASTLTYDIALPYAYTGLPTISATANAVTSTKIITQATAIPGSATVVVKAQDNSEKTYTINFTRTPISSSCDITSFTINNKIGVINGTNITVQLHLTTNVASLSPVVNVSQFATYTPSSPVNFSSPVEYIVTAQDGTQKTYTVAVELIDMVYNGTYPYTTNFPSGFIMPNWMSSPSNGIIFTNPYTGNDKGIWYDDETEITAATSSVIRLNSATAMEFYVSKCQTVTVKLSATGSRTFNMYINGNSTPVATSTVSSNTLATLTYSPNLNEPTLIKVDNPSTSGGATLGFFEVTASFGSGLLSNSSGSTLSFDGKTLHNPTSELVHVFDATGRLVVSSTKDVVLSSTAKGIYFVKSNSGNLKIALNK